MCGVVEVSFSRLPCAHTSLVLVNHFVIQEFEPPTPAAVAGGGAVDEDEELQRAIQASLNDM